VTISLRIVAKGDPVGYRLLSPTFDHTGRGVRPYFRVDQDALGKAGKGLAMDLAALTRVLELAAVYGGAGLDEVENNLHCPFALKINKSCRSCRLCTISWPGCAILRCTPAELTASL